jgi:signal peptidase I
LKDTRWLVKRVVAGPGDPVPAEVRAATNTTVVPRGAVVLLGDNAEVSYDSRQAGFFPLDRVLGPVVSGCIPRGRGSVSRRF